jgi:hypothetical protein
MNLVSISAVLNAPLGTDQVNSSSDLATTIIIVISLCYLLSLLDLVLQ